MHTSHICIKFCQSRAYAFRRSALYIEQVLFCWQINLQNNPVTIGSADRLGLCSPSNISVKIPVPYDTDPINGALYFSQGRFTSGQFIVGQVITVGGLLWPRTFSAYLSFCTTIAGNCSTLLINYYLILWLFSWIPY